jgi:hypothetical protein
MFSVVGFPLADNRTQKKALLMQCFFFAFILMA